MSKIKIEKLSEEELKERGVFKWPIWEKEASNFVWYYDTRERCYILEGDAWVKPDSGETVEFGAGDFVTFPENMKCIWNIIKDIKKHYKFG